MDDAKRELVCSWLVKGRNDLDTASQISAHPAGHLDVAIYQQAAERPSKVFWPIMIIGLSARMILSGWSRRLAKHESKFTAWSEAATTLTPYATVYRYPGESIVSEPTRSEFDEALRIATDLVRFVFSLLPPEVQPP